MVPLRQWMAAIGLLLAVAALAACAPAQVPSEQDVMDTDVTSEALDLTVADAPAVDTASPVSALSYTSDGEAIYSGHADGTIVRRNAEGSAESALEGHDGEVLSLAVSPDGMRLASIGADKRTIIQSTDGSSVWAIPPGLSQANSIDFSPDGAFLAEAYWEKLELWPMDDPSVGATRVEGLEPSIRLARFSPDGTRLTVALANTGLAQPAIFHLDPESGKVLDSSTPDAPIEALFYGPGSQVFVTRSEEGVQVWPSEGSSPTLELPIEDVHALGFSPNGLTLFTAVQADDVLTVSSWNVASGETVSSNELGVDGAVTPAFAPDGVSIAVGHRDGTVTVQPLE